MRTVRSRSTALRRSPLIPAHVFGRPDPNGQTSLPANNWEAFHFLSLRVTRVHFRQLACNAAPIREENWF